MLLGKKFALDLILLLAENETYTLDEILKDGHKVSPKSYFANGGALTAEQSVKSQLLTLLWRAYQDTCLLLANYIDSHESETFYQQSLDML